MATRLHQIWLSPSRRNATEKGNKVTFHLADVFFPSAEELRGVFRYEEELEGTVVNFSDSGSRPNAFAIVEVICKQKVVIPIEKLQPVKCTETLHGESG
jgi:hypothetical protein